MRDTSTHRDGSPFNASESTLPSNRPSLALTTTSSHQDSTPTAPSTPLPLDYQRGLFGSACVLGGGDSNRTGSEPLGVQTPRGAPPRANPLRTSPYRRTKAARYEVNTLGSPLRLTQRSGQDAGNSRPLVRAVPAPMPLWQYSPPSRHARRRSSGGPETIFETLTDILSPSCGPPPPSTASGPCLSSNFDTGSAEPAEDFPTTVALVVLASIRDTVNGECKPPSPHYNRLLKLGHHGEDLECPSVGPVPQGPAEPPKLSSGAKGHHETAPQSDVNVTTRAGSAPAQRHSEIESQSPLSSVPSAAGDGDYYLDESWSSGLLADEPYLNSIVSVDASLLADIPTFNAHRPPPTNLDLVMNLGCIPNWPAVGVTKTELKRIVKACHICHRFMYVDRRAQHCCDGPARDVHAPGFNLVETMLEFQEHAGFSLDDLVFLFFRCMHCLRIFSVTTESGSLDSMTQEWTIHRCKSQS